MTGLLAGRDGLLGGGPCAAVRESTPTAASNSKDSVVRVAGTVHDFNADDAFEHVNKILEAYPAILAFDVNGQYIGHSNGAESQGYLSAGFVDVVVHQEKSEPSKQTTYLQIFRDKPICLSYVLQNMSDGTPAVWTGDVGRRCGKEWYYSDARMYVLLESFLHL